MSYSPQLHAKVRGYLLTATDTNVNGATGHSVPVFWMFALPKVPENSYDEVYPGIYMGDQKTAMNKPGLLELGITHVVNCSQGKEEKGSRQTDTNSRFYRDVGIKYHGMKAIDHSTYNMMPHFREAAEFIDKALKGGGRVYVHCFKGVSRSATIVLAYLMMKRNTDLIDAVKIIRAKRKIHPNDGFIRQLCILSRELYGARFQ